MVHDQVVATGGSNVDGSVSVLVLPVDINRGVAREGFHLREISLVGCPVELLVFCLGHGVREKEERRRREEGRGGEGKEMKKKEKKREITKSRSSQKILESY